MLSLQHISFKVPAVFVRRGLDRSPDDFGRLYQETQADRCDVIIRNTGMRCNNKLKDNVRIRKHRHVGRRQLGMSDIFCLWNPLQLRCETCGDCFTKRYFLISHAMTVHQVGLEITFKAPQGHQAFNTTFIIFKIFAAISRTRESSWPSRFSKPQKSFISLSHPWLSRLRRLSWDSGCSKNCRSSRASKAICARTLHIAQP